MILKVDTTKNQIDNKNVVRFPIGIFNALIGQILIGLTTPVGALFL